MLVAVAFILVFLFGGKDMIPSVLSDESGSIPAVTVYFPQLKGDLTKLQWAHAVNDKDLLKKAIDDVNVMMLEADVVMGKLVGGDELLPIMAHPPKNTSNLSLEMFLHAVINAQKNKKKGIKLDFKSTESFQSSLKIIEPLKKEVFFPVLLNADIIQGPINSLVKPVDPDIFLKLSSSKLPESLLSIGWTTKFGPEMNGTYTKQQLENMKAAIERNHITQPVTLCVRAGIVAESPEIINLVNEIDRFQKNNSTTVTVWMSSDSDPVDMPKLRHLILTLKKNRVFLDVPKFLENELGLNKTESKTAVTAVQEALLSLLTLQIFAAISQLLCFVLAIIFNSFLLLTSLYRVYPLKMLVTK